MNHRVMRHRLNLWELRWQNSRENHLIIDTKTGYSELILHNAKLILYMNFVRIGGKR
jgi:hypothetical protein